MVQEHLKNIYRNIMSSLTPGSVSLSWRASFIVSSSAWCTNIHLEFLWLVDKWASHIKLQTQPIITPPPLAICWTPIVPCPWPSWRSCVDLLNMLCLFYTEVMYKNMNKKHAQQLLSTVQCQMFFKIFLLYRKSSSQDNFNSSDMLSSFPAVKSLHPVLHFTYSRWFLLAGCNYCILQWYYKSPYIYTE